MHFYSLPRLCLFHFAQKIDYGSTNPFIQHNTSIMFLMRFLTKKIYSTCYIVLLDESTKNTTIRVLFVANKIGKNVEYEAKYKYIPSLDILELDTTDLSPWLKDMPRIFQINQYYSESIQKTVYSFSYIQFDAKGKPNKVLPIVNTVEFLANKEHVIQL